jgi:methyltransferase
MRLPLIAFATFVPMIVEAMIATRHDQRLRAEGAVEPRDDVYRWMQIAYPGAFIAMVVEGCVSPEYDGNVLIAGILIFVLAKALKYWAIATLGDRWTFRVLVPPRSVRIVRGPYRVLRHPNYIAVIGELAGVALMTGARMAGPIGTCVFLILILARIRVEERALAAR